MAANKLTAIELDEKIDSLKKERENVKSWGDAHQIGQGTVDAMVRFYNREIDRYRRHRNELVQTHDREASGGDNRTGNQET